jgi:repressor LexA
MLFRKFFRFFSFSLLQKRNVCDKMGAGDNMDTKKLLKEARIKRGLTMKQVADMVGVSESTISRWESGIIANMTREKIVLLSDALHISPSDIMGWEKEETPKVHFPEATPIQITGFIPVYGEIPAGVPNYEDCQVIDYVSTSYAHPEDYFALRVKGTSMINAGIPDGAYVTIKKQNTADDGQIVACRLNGEEATLKRFRRQGDTVMLMPENPEFTPILVSAAEFSEGRAQILGVAKQVTVKI